MSNNINQEELERYVEPTDPQIQWDEQEVVVENSVGIRLKMLPFFLFFSLLSLWFLVLPVWEFTGALALKGFLVCWAVVLILAIPTWISWFCVSPRRLRLDLEQHVYSLTEGLWPWMKTHSGTDMDFKCLFIQQRKRFLRPARYQVFLAWKRVRATFILRSFYNSQSEAETWASTLAERLGVPFLGSFASRSSYYRLDKPES